jgi:hypothetical protein
VIGFGHLNTVLDADIPLDLNKYIEFSKTVMTDDLFALKPSLIPNAGIGCFSYNAFVEGDNLRSLDNYQYIAAGHYISLIGSGGFSVRHENEIPDLFLKYCFLKGDSLYWCPRDFFYMGKFWYINHAKEPNVVMSDNMRLVAARDIHPGEELTMYYKDLLTHPKNKLWVQETDI